MRLATLCLVLSMATTAHAGRFTRERFKQAWHRFLWGPPRSEQVTPPLPAPKPVPPKVYTSLHGRDAAIRRGFALAKKLEGGHWKYPSRALLTLSYGASNEPRVKEGYALARELLGADWEVEGLALLTQSFAAAGVGSAEGRRAYAVASKLETDPMTRALLSHAYLASGGDAARLEAGHALARGLTSDPTARALLTNAFLQGGEAGVREGLALADALDPEGRDVTRALIVHAFIGARGDAGRVRQAYAAAARLDPESHTARALLAHAVIAFGEPRVKEGFALATQLEGGFLASRSRALLTWAYGAARGDGQAVRDAYDLSKELDQGEWDNTSRALITCSLFEDDAAQLVPITAVLVRPNP